MSIPVRCRDCRHRPTFEGWCRRAQTAARSFGAPRTCEAWAPEFRPDIRLMMPPHANVVPPVAPGKLPDGTEYRRPRFVGMPKVWEH
jgi:hypothetical protein